MEKKGREGKVWEGKGGHRTGVKDIPAVYAPLPSPKSWIGYGHIIQGV